MDLGLSKVKGMWNKLSSRTAPQSNYDDLEDQPVVHELKEDYEPEELSPDPATAHFMGLAHMLNGLGNKNYERTDSDNAIDLVISTSDSTPIYLRYRNSGDMVISGPIYHKADVPKPPPESDDLISALIPYLQRWGKEQGIEGIVLENRYKYLDYSTEEYPDFTQYHFAWTEITAIKDGVSYPVDIDIYDQSYSLWGDGIISVHNPNQRKTMEYNVTAMQMFYTPEDYASVVSELTPEEIEEKNKEIADRIGIPPITKIGLGIKFAERGSVLESSLIEGIKNAQKFKKLSQSINNFTLKKIIKYI